MDFFVSHASEDRSWAEWLAVELERAGYSTVTQSFDIRPGSNFVSVIQAAAVTAKRTIAVLSPDYLESEFGKAEWGSAFAADPTGEKGLLLPVRVRPCTPRGFLATRVYVDLVGVDETVARKKLLAAADRGRPRPTSASFPGGRVDGVTFPGLSVARPAARVSKGVSAGWILAGAGVAAIAVILAVVVVLSWGQAPARSDTCGLDSVKVIVPRTVTESFSGTFRVLCLPPSGYQYWLLTELIDVGVHHDNNYYAGDPSIGQSVPSDLGVYTIPLNVRDARNDRCVVVVAVRVALTPGQQWVNDLPEGAIQVSRVDADACTDVQYAGAPAPLPSTGTISSPIEGAAIQQSVVVIGMAKNVPSGHELWLFVRPTGGTVYLPANGVRDGVDTFAVHVDADGSWYQQNVEFGAQEDGSGGEYELILVDVGPDGVARLKKYFTEPREWDGVEGTVMMGYPGTRRLSSVTIKRA